MQNYSYLFGLQPQHCARINTARQNSSVAIMTDIRSIFSVGLSTVRTSTNKFRTDQLTVNAGSPVVSVVRSTKESSLAPQQSPTRREKADNTQKWWFGCACNGLVARTVRFIAWWQPTARPHGTDDSSKYWARTIPLPIPRVPKKFVSKRIDSNIG